MELKMRKKDRNWITVSVSIIILLISLYTYFYGFPLHRIYAKYEAKNYIESKYGLEFYNKKVHYSFDKPEDYSGFSVLLNTDEHKRMGVELDANLYEYKTHVQVNVVKLGDRSSYYDNLMEAIWLNQIRNELYPTLEGVSNSRISIVGIGLHFEGKRGEDSIVIEDHHFDKYKEDQFDLNIFIEERIDECPNIKNKLGDLFAKVVENEYRINEIAIIFGDLKNESEILVFSSEDYQNYDDVSNILDYLD